MRVCNDCGQGSASLNQADFTKLVGIGVAQNVAKHASDTTDPLPRVMTQISLPGIGSRL